MRVRNMTSARGNFVPNQFVIHHEGKITFQSYDSIIAVRDGREVTLDRNRWNYSTTTGKYRNEFLGEGIAETRRKIEDGTYKLADLN